MSIYEVKGGCFLTGRFAMFFCCRVTPKIALNHTDQAIASPQHASCGTSKARRPKGTLLELCDENNHFLGDDLGLARSKPRRLNRSIVRRNQRHGGTICSSIRTSLPAVL